MNCANCGQKLPEGNRFCENCGAPVSIELPKMETVHQPVHQQGGPGVPMGGGGMRREEISMKQPQAKKPAKSWIWIIVIALIALGCCCAAVIGGGLIYLRNQGQSWQDVLPDGLEDFSDTSEALPELEIDSPLPEEAAQPTQADETMQEPGYLPEDHMLAVTSSGIWMVNAQSRAATQISYDQLDVPWDLNDGMSPDKKFFAFFTGFGGSPVNPMLVVLDLVNQTTLLQLELTGPIIQPGMEGTHGDPSFEAFGAMQSIGSLAWSPDGTHLAFIAARDGDSADVYIFSRSDSSVTRLSQEAGHASDLHWSPDGQFLQYLSIFTFGTGAGATMEALWVYEFQSNQAQLLETLESNGEDFLAWTDNSHFLINSWGRLCGGAYNLRIVDATSFEQQVIVEEGFTAVAYDPENQFGMFSVAYTYDNCGNSEPLDPGLMIFGESVPVLGADGPIMGEIGRKKFEQIIAYGIRFIPQGNLFTVYGDDGLPYIYYNGPYGYINLEILPEVKGLTPYPSPTGEYWAWASSMNTGLWITEKNSNPIELSPLFTGMPLWSQDGQTIYFFEINRLFSASAPQFSTGTLVVEIPGEQILSLVK
ncbi:MAG: zinc-ribbon domain-containing protein [Anaerolineaceae bacterium]|nr:zinc-ribbon domain-containing protein [Anaerolineaceae bacterium]